MTKSSPFIAVLFISILATIPSPCQALEPTYMVTYGAEAQTIEGDDDFLQALFIRIPEGLKEPLYIRIFDADCGGNLDARYTKAWNTRTRFRILGGKRAYSDPGLRRPTPSEAALNAGNLLAEETFGQDPFRDSRWHTFAKVNPEQGEKIGQYRYFKLFVAGVSGDDGNRFSVAVSLSPRRNLSPDGLAVFSFTPTIHLPRSDVFAEMRFFVPKDEDAVIAHNFDSSRAFIGLDTRFRENLPVVPSGQDEWAQSSVALEKSETGRMAALRFAGGEEIPNDGTFYVSDKKGNLLPIWLPVYLHKPNSRPVPHVDIEPLGECDALLFDGSRSIDPDGDALSFSWDFGDGGTGRGERITHKYESPGQYKASVTVADASGQVSNSAIKRFTVTINHPPIAAAGPDIISSPREKLEFDASASSDPDGKIKDYHWDFGDGNRARGAQVQHTYQRPDVYVVTLRVTDNSGTTCDTSTDECEVWINARPVLDIGEDRIASVGESIELSGANSGDSDGKIATYQWDMGDGTKIAGREINHAYDKPGTYKVKLRITDDSGATNADAYDTLTIFVNDPPIADAGPDIRGSSNEPVMFDGSGSYDPDGQLIEFTYNFGDGTVSRFEMKDSKFPAVEHTYDAPGEYLVTLNVKDSSGSSSDTAYDEVLVIINHPPVAQAGSDQWVTQSEVQFDGSGSGDQDGELIEYLWDFGDGSVGKGVAPVHTYECPGTYTVWITVVDDSGTSSGRASDKMTVIVNHRPIADAGPDHVAAPGQEILFDASGSLDPDGEIRSFQWNFGNGVQSDRIDVQESGYEKMTYSYAKPGKYTVQLTVYDNSGHETAVSFDEAVVIVNDSPVAIANISETSKPQHISKSLVIAPGDSVYFDGTESYDPDGRIISYQWNILNAECQMRNDKAVECGSLTSPLASYPLPVTSFRCVFTYPGVYSASLSVADNSRVENSVSQDDVFIRVNHKPLAHAGKNIHTNERRIILDASDSSDADGDPLIHTWDFGDDSPPGRGQKVFHTYTKSGTYPVILTVDDGTGVKNSRTRASIRVKINDSPIADAGPDKTVCSGKVVIFDGVNSVDPEGGVMKYHWDFGDGTTEDVVNPTKIYNNGGFYPVKLTVTDDSGLSGGNTDTDQIMVEVIESPLADAGPDQTSCAGRIVQFDGTGSRDIDGLVNRYEWDFGDGATGGGPNPVHVYSKAGRYRVLLIITGDQMADCDNTDDDDMIVTIHEAPLVDFTCPLIAELGKPVKFTGLSAVDPEPASQQTTDDNGQQVSDNNQQPTENNQQPTENDQQSITKWEWSFGPDATASGKETNHTFDKPGDYIVTLTVTSDSGTACNQSSVQKRLTINAPPTAKAGDDLLAGVSQFVMFDGSSSSDSDGVISKYEWDFGDGNTGAGLRTRHKYEKPGKYQVRLTVRDNTALPNNNDTDSLTVTVNHAPVPVISMLGDQGAENPIFHVCPGKEVSLSGKGSEDADGEIVSYLWNPGDGSLSKQGDEIKHIWHSPGNYIVLLEVDDGMGLNNSRTQTSALIVVNSSPLPDAGPDRVAAPEKEVLFDGSGSSDQDGNITSFEWDFGDGEQGKGIKTGHVFKVPGTYQVRLKVTDDSATSCASSEDIIRVRINAPPLADAGKDREIFIGGAHDEILFDGTGSSDPDGDPLTFYWDFGDGTSAQSGKVKHRYEKPGQYVVRLRVDDGTGLECGTRWDEVVIRARVRK